MPAPFGVTSTGFNRPTLQELIGLFETSERAALDPNTDVAADSLLGQLNGIFGRQLAVAWEAIETSYHGFDPDRAEAMLLTALAKLTGTARRGADYSLIAASVNMTAGTTLLAGTHFANVSGKPDLLFTPLVNFTAPTDGWHTGVVFRAQNTGPIAVAANTLTIIATAVVGWTQIGNPAAATPGSEGDSDAVLRDRREQELSRQGSCTLDAIRADLTELPSIDGVLMFENTISVWSSDGIPPHAFEAVVFDGVVPLANEDQIAQSLWSNKPAGIRSFGAVIGTALDANGDEQPVAFSRSGVVNIYLTFTIEPTADYVGDDAFKTAIVDRCNALYGLRKSVIYAQINSLPFDLDLGVSDSSLKLGTAPAPIASLNIPIGPRQIARFQTDNVVVVVA